MRNILRKAFFDENSPGCKVTAGKGKFTTLSVSMVVEMYLVPQSPTVCTSNTVAVVRVAATNTVQMILELMDLVRWR